MPALTLDAHADRGQGCGFGNHETVLLKIRISARYQCNRAFRIIVSILTNSGVFVLAIRPEDFHRSYLARKHLVDDSFSNGIA
jgi:hypothetical protein